MALDDLKALVEEGNKTIAALRGEMDGVKSQDVVHKDKIAKIEADLATTMSAKAAADLKAKALEDRLAEVETKASRLGLIGKDFC